MRGLALEIVGGQVHEQRVVQVVVGLQVRAGLDRLHKIGGNSGGATLLPGSQRRTAVSLGRRAEKVRDQAIAYDRCPHAQEQEKHGQDETESPVPASSGRVRRRMRDWSPMLRR